MSMPHECRCETCGAVGMIVPSPLATIEHGSPKRMFDAVMAQLDECRHPQVDRGGCLAQTCPDCGALV